VIARIAPAPSPRRTMPAKLTTAPISSRPAVRARISAPQSKSSVWTLITAASLVVTHDGAFKKRYGRFMLRVTCQYGVPHAQGLLDRSGYRQQRRDVSRLHTHRRTC